MNEPIRTQWEIRCAFNGFCKQTLYENGARVKEIAAYIGDLESTTERYYIAVRKKIIENGKVKQVVMVPGAVVKNDADM